MAHWNSTSKSFCSSAKFKTADCAPAEVIVVKIAKLRLKSGEFRNSEASWLTISSERHKCGRSALTKNAHHTQVQVL